MDPRAEVRKAIPRRARRHFSLGQVQIALALGLLIGAMLFAWFYVGPSGQRLGISGFIALFLREFLLLGLFLVGAVLVSIAWAWQSIRRLLERGRSAPTGPS